jgi:DNA-binding PadR family transcriptional regulator
MPEEDVELDDIDELGVEILAAVQRHGGESDSRKVKMDLGGIETTPFNYRVRRYFEPLGLLDTWQPEGEPGSIPPKKVELTEKGEEFLENRRDVEPTGVEDRVGQLEQQVEKLQREKQELDEKNRELEAAIEQAGAADLQRELQEINDQTSSLQDRIGVVEQDPVIQSDIAGGLINAAIILGNTSKDMLIEEFGEEKVLEQRDQIKAEMEEEGKLID